MSQGASQGAIDQQALTIHGVRLEWKAKTNEQSDRIVQALIHWDIASVAQEADLRIMHPLIHKS